MNDPVGGSGASGSRGRGRARGDRPHEHEFEPQYGLPEPLPAGEHMLWQGSPQWRVLARQIFHVRLLAAYFGVILALRAAGVLIGGGSGFEALLSALWLLPPVLFALGIVWLMAWLSSRTTVYTITDRRVVMRIGIVLSLTFNLPFGSIAAAGLRSYPDGSGDIPLTLASGNKIAFVHLWPHARPWRVTRPEPMLCCLRDAAQVAQILAKAWANATGRPEATTGTTATHPGMATNDGSPATNRASASPLLAMH